MLNLGARSLQAERTATEVAGQNIANVNNPAYSRQRAVITSSTPLQTSIGSEGTGAQVEQNDIRVDGRQLPDQFEFL